MQIINVSLFEFKIILSLYINIAILMYICQGAHNGEERGTRDEK